MHVHDGRARQASFHEDWFVRFRPAPRPSDACVSLWSCCAGEDGRAGVGQVVDVRPRTSNLSSLCFHRAILHTLGPEIGPHARVGSRPLSELPHPRITIGRRSLPTPVGSPSDRRESAFRAVPDRCRSQISPIPVGSPSDPVLPRSSLETDPAAISSFLAFVSYEQNERVGLAHARHSRIASPRSEGEDTCTCSRSTRRRPGGSTGKKKHAGPCQGKRQASCHVEGRKEDLSCIWSVHGEPKGHRHVRTCLCQ